MKSPAALVSASLILGVAVVAGSVLVSRSIDRGTEELASVKASLGNLESSLRAGGAAPPTRAAQAPRGRPDPSRRYEIELGPAPVKGPADAPITIVEFSDFQCPFCNRVNPTLRKIEQEYGDKVRIAFKHLPLSMHPKAPDAHRAAEAAHRQGKFWEMHDRIFANQREMSVARYLEYAGELGLDVERFKRDVASAEVRQRVDQDASHAAKLGITGTPSFFVNGRFLSGAKPFSSFKQVIDEELAKG